MRFRFVWLILLTTICLPAPADAQSAAAERSMVATVHPLATDAGVAAFRNGGNAVDAAVAAALTLGVVDNHNSGIGGGCFILLRTADGDLAAIDGRETAPAKAHRDMYLRDGHPAPELSRTGALASGVPGALAAYQQAVSRHGRLTLKDLLLPAADIAQRGFAIDRVYAEGLKAVADELTQFEASRSILLTARGVPYKEGEILKQVDLAKTYRAIAEHGVDWFYRGPFAEATETWMKANGGLLAAEDFASYRARVREPIVTTYRGYTIVGFPPPSSGGVHVAQILNIVEHFDLAELHAQDRAAFIHAIAEAMKLAFADRAYWLGDPDFAKVPRGLVDKDYAQRLAKKIDVAKAAKVSKHGQPPGANSDCFGTKHTTHIAAADAEGNWVAITATINTTFGSKVIIPGTGVVMNNEMDDFAIAPGVPNAFGLIGAEANSIQPGKRPLSSMSPTIVLEEGQSVMTLGAAGGPRIISQTLLNIINRLDLGMTVEEAVAAPRFHHQWVPDALFVEQSVCDDVVRQLQKLGHHVQQADYVGVSQAIEVTPENFLRGAHDPRVPGKAAGF